MSDRMTHRHVHRAPCHLVFECLTTPAHLTRFWGPVGTTTPIDGIVVDLRPGGAFETLMVADDGSGQHRMRAVYDRVEPPNLLVWREVESGMVTTVTLTELDDGTTLTETVQTGAPLGYRSPEARAGWRTSLDRFASHVASVGGGL
jgi:uncharacterized protein YndB with AHSA1/START domain